MRRTTIVGIKVSGRHNGISFQTKTGLGLHWMEFHALTPKS